MKGKPDTSWESVASWYGGMVNEPDSYQRKVILPNLLRALGTLTGKRVADIGSGTGFFSAAFHKAGADVIGVDASPALVAAARKSVPGARFETGDAADLSMIGSGTIDRAVIVLAIQNMKDAERVLAEAKRIVKRDGRLFLVLNHPAFRIPKASFWGFAPATNTQYRRIDRYLSESSVVIDMTPGTADETKKVHTRSFHRPLQWYVKALGKHGFAIIRLEEWISHKKSGAGPRQAAEDRARKEIPLFLMLEAVVH